MALDPHPSFDAFDIVVLDEVFETPPWDAIGAIARLASRSSSLVTRENSRRRCFSHFAIDEEAEAPDDQDVVEMERVLDEAVASGCLSFSFVGTPKPARKP